MSEQVEVVYRESWSRLLAFATRHLEHVYDAEDAVQETFLAWLESGKVLDEEQYMAWLFRVTENEVRNVQRYRVQQWRVTAWSLDDKDAPATELAGADTVGAWQESAEMRRQVDEVLERFSPTHRLCIILQSEGFTSREIGLALGISEERVRAYQMNVRDTVAGWSKPVPSREALDLVREWVSNNLDAMAVDGRVPSGLCFGAMRTGRYVGVRSEVVKSIVEGKGFDRVSIIRQWIERGVIEAPEGRYLRSVMVGRTPVKMHVFPWTVWSSKASADPVSA